MESFIVFDSQYGNTEQIARAVAEVFGEAGQVHIVRADRASALHLSEADLLAVGGPTQRHGLSPALAQLLENIPGGVLNGVAAVAFDTRLRCRVRRRQRLAKHWNGPAAPSWRSRPAFS
jgi:flavodoxin I